MIYKQQAAVINTVYKLGFHVKICDWDIEIHTDRVPLSIIVLLSVEDLLLFAHRQPDPALGHV